MWQCAQRFSLNVYLVVSLLVSLENIEFNLFYFYANMIFSAIAAGTLHTILINNSEQMRWV